MNPMIKTFFFRMTLFIAYGVFGGWIFSLIEMREETYEATGNRVLSKLRKKMEKKYNMTNTTDFDDFVKDVTYAKYLMGKQDWTFLNGCGFTFAAITTVGFGDITPQTPGGQGFVIPYCLIGIAITMMALKTAGELLILGIKTTAIAFEKKVLGRQNPQRTLTKCLVISIFNIIAFTCVISVVAMHLEGWTYLECIYFSFVTYSTMGFGDYVPLMKFRQNVGGSDTKLILYGALLMLPFIIGLCIVASLLNVLVECSEDLQSYARDIFKCRVCGRRSHNGTADTASHENEARDIKMEEIN